MIYKEFYRIYGVLLEPCARIAKAETVAPGIHVGHEAFPPNTRDVIGEYDLQVTYCGLLKVVASGVPVKPVAPLAIHANDMAGLVQE